MRLIDADELIKEEQDKWNNAAAEFDVEPEKVESIKVVDIEKAPTIDPVKHGEWDYYDTIGCDEIYICTVCEGFVKGKSLYCPLCGAKMDKKE